MKDKQWSLLSPKITVGLVSNTKKQVCCYAFLKLCGQTLDKTVPPSYDLRSVCSMHETLLYSQVLWKYIPVSTPQPWIRKYERHDFSKHYSKL